ncbi:ROK family protein [Sanguibacter sp. HDW7]|uniref:ROK family protein n=1 Tax=Sanguibacter sp. HDW7 TaxID=2714931 RepID=UPI00140941ED|nr:ROK family protein [Sanguibacter sp. HDW7]QIK84677.1 ROK family protein [Sanguibacter sp. HDW7]
MTALTIGVDLGGTKIAGALVAPDGAIVGDVVRVPTPAADGGEAVLAAILGVVAHLRRTHGSVDAVGVAAAGVIDTEGRVVSATDLLPGWAGTPVSQRVAEATGLPAATLNDVHAAALGEATHGAGRGAGVMLLAAVGTGVGGGVVRDGRVVLGRAGVAGSVGHVVVPEAAGHMCSCGVVGHAEAVASGPALERLHVAAGGDAVPLRRVAELAAAGDPRAAAIVAGGARALGRALAGAVSVLDPDVVVVGGGVAQIGTTYLDAVAAALREDLMPAVRDVPVVPAALGTEAPIVGAAVATRRDSGA